MGVSVEVAPPENHKSRFVGSALGGLQNFAPLTGCALSLGSPESQERPGSRPGNLPGAPKGPQRPPRSAQKPPRLGSLGLSWDALGLVGTYWGPLGCIFLQ